jgi:hypothetical protein
MGICPKIKAGARAFVDKQGKTLNRTLFSSFIFDVVVPHRSMPLFKDRVMEITGQIIQMLPEVTGTGRSGNSWRKQEFILETHGQYPRKVCMSLWGDKIDQFPLQQGSEITASVEVESREYNGRWYTDIRAWKIAPAAPGQGGQAYGGAPLAASGMPSSRPAAGPAAGYGSAGSPLPAEPDYSVQGGDDMPF